mmetsp:Transcript_73382/g.122615  ORF Transcript_73382/g.122615 Transcript_73382/m.122615 type:complete len:135 (+) Transcript_73382:197-601(+)
MSLFADQHEGRAFHSHHPAFRILQLHPPSYIESRVRTDSACTMLISSVSFHLFPLLSPLISWPSSALLLKQVFESDGASDSVGDTLMEFETYYLSRLESALIRGCGFEAALASSAGLRHYWPPKEVSSHEFLVC